MLDILNNNLIHEVRRSPWLSTTTAARVFAACARAAHRRQAHIRPQSGRRRRPARAHKAQVPATARRSPSSRGRSAAFPVIKTRGEPFGLRPDSCRLWRLHLGARTRCLTPTPFRSRRPDAENDGRRRLRRLREPAPQRARTSGHALRCRL